MKTYGVEAYTRYSNGKYGVTKKVIYQFAVDANNKKEAKEIAKEFAFDYTLEDVRKNRKAYGQVLINNKVADDEEIAQWKTNSYGYNIFIF